MGPRGVAILLALSTAVSVGSFLFVRSFPLFLIAAIAYATSQTGLAAARQALLAGLVQPAERTRIRAFLQSTVNAGLAVGAALGGVALRFDTAPAYLTVFAIDAAGFLIAATLIHRVPAVKAVTLRVAGAWEISFGLAPADKQGQYQGFFGTGPADARMLGPALLTTLVLGWGPIGWVIVGALFLGTSVVTGPAVRWAARTRSTDQVTEPSLEEERAA